MASPFSSPPLSPFLATRPTRRRPASTSPTTITRTTCGPPTPTPTTRVFVEMLDYHLRLTDETADNPSPFQQPIQRRRRLLAVELRTPQDAGRVRAAHRPDPGAGTSASRDTRSSRATAASRRRRCCAACITPGGWSAATACASPMAVAMENQTLPLGLASLWAGSGAQYSWRGVCGCASRVPTAPLAARATKSTGATGHDGQRVLMKWHSAGAEGNGRSAATPRPSTRWRPSSSSTRDPGFLSRYRAPGARSPTACAPPSASAGMPSIARPAQPVPRRPASSIPSPTTFTVIAQAETNAERQVIVSNEEDFFEDFAATHGATFPRRPSPTATSGTFTPPRWRRPRARAPSRRKAALRRSAGGARAPARARVPRRPRLPRATGPS